MQIPDNYPIDQFKSSSIDSSEWMNDFSSLHKDQYVGPTPLSEDYWASKQTIKFRRNGRNIQRFFNHNKKYQFSAENGRNLFRVEFGGFLPKMNPSVEIDSTGAPIKNKA